jgi:hypothetical protein
MVKKVDELVIKAPDLESLPERIRACQTIAELRALMVEQTPETRNSVTALVARKTDQLVAGVLGVSVLP